MQMQIVIRPIIAAVALVIVWTASPRAAIAQQCRRTCETRETRDVRGCCVPKAASKPAGSTTPRPERTPPSGRPARDEPKAEAPAAKPSEPPATKPSEPPASTPSRKPATSGPVDSPAIRPTEPPAASKPEEPRRTRQRREPDPAPIRPATGESARPVPVVPTPDERARSARTTPSTPASQAPAATQGTRAGQPPGATAPANLRTEHPAARHTEPIAPSRSDTERPADARPAMLEPPRADLTPSMLAANQESEPSRRWPVWMPWAVVGAGAVVTGVGGWLYTSAADEYSSFDKSFNERCMYGGCNDSEVPDLTDQLDRARTLETTSRISMIAGGLTVAGGVALVFLNQITGSTSERATARRFVVPTLGPGAAGISAGISF
jgi:hypothetical protein